MVAELRIDNFTRTDHLLHGDQLPTFVGELLGESLQRWLTSLLEQSGVQSDPVILGSVEEGAIVKGAVFVAEGARVEAGSYIVGPAWIGPNSEVRHGAYIRGNVYVARDCVVGHATEVKGSCFLDGAKAGHFAYVGDSILCRMVNLGAGTKLANLTFDGRQVSYRDPATNKKVSSGRRKLGAIIGDHAQTGCNAVLSPGTLLLPETAVFPCSHFRGTLTSGSAR